MPSTTRRDFVKSLASGAILAGANDGRRAQEPTAQRGAKTTKPAARPNVILYIADQMRWDFVGATGLNPSAKTPNLDKIAQRGVSFTGAVTNQPLCSPSRASMLTGQYALTTGMWNNAGLAFFNHDLPTLASILRSSGYTANFVGKWHLGPTTGPVLPQDRGGFLDFWEGADALELTSHPYSGTIWDSNGNPIPFEDQFRVDFITDRAIRFLTQPQEKPFLLHISQLEPHFQNDLVRFVAPKGYAERYQNPFVPSDLLHLPGDWQAQLPDYYGCIEKIDESVGRILQTLEDQNQLDNTIFLFSSDHGCHFRTRNAEYKRSAHDSSIRVPFLVQGPGLDHSVSLPEIVSNIHMTPTLLEAAALSVPKSMKGRSLLPLIHDPHARRDWENKALVQISASMVGRAIRTKEWTYCVRDPSLDGNKVPSSMCYEEYQMYNNYSDPAQLVNLAGREPFKETATELREELLRLIVDSGEPSPAITRAHQYP